MLPDVLCNATDTLAHGRKRKSMPLVWRHRYGYRTTSEDGEKGRMAYAND